MTWTQQNDNLNAAIIAAFGESVTYSRQANGTLSAVEPFQISVSIETGPGFEDPEAKIAGRVLVPPGQIPGGPQKGDLLLLTPGLKGLASGTYTVQYIDWDTRTDTAYLFIRWTGQ